MRQKFSMAKRLLWACAGLLLLAASAARGDEIALAPGVPDRYVVQKGDTLWGIAQKFLRDPWRWPDIWRMNREQIKNPHWIYPGDVIVLVRGTASAPPQLKLERGTVRLEPTIRSTPLDANAIPSIPPGDLEPYLSRPLVTGPEGLATAAEIVAGRGNRAYRGDGDIVYVAGLDPKAGNLWLLYRPGKTLTAWGNPDDILGYEQDFLGMARVERFGTDVATVKILTARQEVVVGDLLVPAPPEKIVNYVPHAPQKPVAGHIIELAQNANEAGRGWLATLDKGAADGIDVGAVLAIDRVVAPVADPWPSTEPERMERFSDQTITVPPPQHYLDIPPERIGLLFVYRVFDRVAYAVLLNTSDPVEVGDVVRNP
jgi:hypothetical protein